jgi:hypothetical protein
MVLSPDPKTYVHPATHTRRNIQYGPHADHRLNVYRNETRLTGGNPVLIFDHPGGWSSKDKTFAVEGTALLGPTEKYTFAYLLDQDYGNTTIPWDIVSIETRGGAHDSISPLASSADNYEPRFEATNPGTGPMQYPAYLLSSFDDAQRAVQFVKDNKTRFGFNGQVAFWGASAGATHGLVVGFMPSRHYTIPSQKRSRWEACSDSSVLGVLNYYGVINMSPWFTDLYLAGGLFGFQTDINIASGIKSRHDVEKLLLVPDSSGLYPSTVQTNGICKSISAVDVIAAIPPERNGVKVRSIYVDAEASLVPVTTYVTIPPYTSHHPIQATLLQTVCDAVDVDHEYQTIATGTQANWETTLADTVTWLNSLV